MIKDLFRYFVLPGNLPGPFQGVQGAIDYIAGMTDRFAMDEHLRLTDISVSG